jgi:phosphoenolpyruvate carboxykinase (ATP)
MALDDDHGTCIFYSLTMVPTTVAYFDPRTSMRGLGREKRVMSLFDLKQHGITASLIHHNLPPSVLYEHAIRYDKEATIADNGALVAYSGEKTGRSPKDKRVVKNSASEREVWWGTTNIPLDPKSFKTVRQRALDYLSICGRVYCFDGFAGWDPKYRIKIRVICSRPYHALFMHTMLIRPTTEELASFGQPDFVIYNAGVFPADSLMTEVGSKTCVSLNLEDRELVILGTEYAGEMKKGVFTVANYFAPKRGVLSMHCSATADKQTRRSSLLFGLSGTGKTTLSADPKRYLIGDDEHCWGDDGIFNIEGGCYAKAINLTSESEPDIFAALRFGAVLENVVLEEDHTVDYTDISITENTRGAYPINFIHNSLIPCVAGHPTDVIFLTCDAFGVLPPVSSLTPEQAMFHFISGYTAKVAGTEVGIKEPTATFSPCFGGPFLVWHPKKYAELLAEKIKKHNSRVWLVNTGWSGGEYGVGKRIKLGFTRAIINAIHDGTLTKARRIPDSVFGFDVVEECIGVPGRIMVPRNAWADKSAYDSTAKKLFYLFQENFKKYEGGVKVTLAGAGTAA